MDFYGHVPYLPIRYSTDDDLESRQHLDAKPTGMWDLYHTAIITLILVCNSYREKYSHDENKFHLDLNENMKKNVDISSYYKSSTQGKFIPRLLFKMWDIILSSAKLTYNTNTQDHTRLVNSYGK